MKYQYLIFIFLLFGAATFPVEAQQREQQSKTTTTVTEYGEITGDEKRRWIEERILKGEHYHDGAGELLYVGTMESVPALLKILRDVPPMVIGPDGKGTPYRPVPGEPDNVDRTKLVYACTTAHAIGALSKITGQNFSLYEEWNEWWQNYLAEKEQPEDR